MSKELEQILKEKFQQFNAEVSPDLFDKIVEKRAKRGLILWPWLKWSAAILLVGATIGLGVYYFNDDATDIQSKANSEIEQDNNTTINNSDLETGTDNAGFESQVSGSNDGQLAKTPNSNSKGTYFDQSAQYGQNEQNVSALNEQDSDNAPSTDDELNKPENEDPIVNNDLPITQKEAYTNTAILLTPIKTQVDELLSDQKIELQNDPLNKHKVEPLPIKASLYALDIVGGYGGSIWGAASNGDGTEYVRSTEKPSLSSNIEIAISRKLNNNWSVRAGLRYTELNHAFSLDQLDEWNDTSFSSRQVTIYHPVNPPQVITVNDTTVTKMSQINQLTASNSRILISLPVELEKQFYFGNNWLVLGKVGTVLSLYDKQRGLRQVSEDQVVVLEDQKGAKVGILSATAALGVGYRFNDKISCLIYPQYSLLMDRNAMMNSHAIFGNVGLRIDL